MKTNEKNPVLAARDKLVRFLKSKAYPVIPVSRVSDTEEKEGKNTKEVFIDQLKKSIKDPCIFIHFPEDDDQEN
jgi:hypothetical protein